MSGTGYRSLKTLSQVTIALLAGNAGLAALGFAITAWVDSGAMTASLEGDAETSGLISALVVIGLLAVGIFVGTVVSFCMFVHRAASNLRALGRSGLSFTPGWAVGWYFVPFANLIKPYHAMKEIVLASDPDAPKSEYGSDWMSNPLPSIVGAWWTLWIFRMVVDRISSRMETGLVFEAVALAVELGAVATAILVVQLVARRQDALAGIDRDVALGSQLGHVAERR